MHVRSRSDRAAARQVILNRFCSPLAAIKERIPLKRTQRDRSTLEQLDILGKIVRPLAPFVRSFMIVGLWTTEHAQRDMR